MKNQGHCINSTRGANVTLAHSSTRLEIELHRLGKLPFRKPCLLSLPDPSHEENVCRGGNLIIVFYPSELSLDSVPSCIPVQCLMLIRVTNYSHFLSPQESLPQYWCHPANWWAEGSFLSKNILMTLRGKHQLWRSCNKTWRPRSSRSPSSILLQWVCLRLTREQEKLPWSREPYTGRRGMGFRTRETVCQSGNSWQLEHRRAVNIMFGI